MDSVVDWRMGVLLLPFCFQKMLLLVQSSSFPRTLYCWWPHLERFDLFGSI